MIVVEHVGSEGRVTEEATDERAAQRREIELRTRGTRFVVWYVISDEQGSAA